MANTRVGGESYEAIVATLEQISEAIDLLNRVDDQRAAQIASLEVAQAELRDEVRRHVTEAHTAFADELRRLGRLRRRVEELEGHR